MRFSYYENGIKNVVPSKEVDIKEFIELLKQDSELLQRIRKEKDKDKKNKLKEGLSYVTFGGVFNKRSKKDLKEASGFACFDFDGVENIKEIKNKLIQNIYTHLVFVSPSGKGLKLIVKIPKVKDDEEYKQYWISIAKHFNIEANDEATKDICRACYVSVDKEPYYNPNSKVYEKKMSWLNECIEEAKKDTPKDTSRSSLEYRKCIALLRERKSREEVYKVMEAYSKWASAPEQYRTLTFEKAEDFVLQEKENNKEVVESIEANEETLSILKDEKLFENITIKELDKKIVREFESRKTIFLVTCMRNVENLNKATDNLMINAVSGTGKDFVSEAIFELIHPKEKEELIRISPKVLSYTRNKAINPLATWKGIALRLEDVGNSVLNDDAFKVMSSANPNKINYSKIVNKGKIINIEIEGKPSIILTIANANPKEETLRRFPICYLDEDIDQTKEVLKRQAEYAEKGLSVDFEDRYIQALRCLKRVKVSVPFAKVLVDLFCPENVIVRTHFPRFLDYIKASCSLHQFQREQDEKGFFIAEPKDYDIARIALIKTTSNILMIPLTKLQKNILEAFENYEEYCSENTLEKDSSPKPKSVDEVAELPEIQKLNITDKWLRTQLDYLSSKSFLIKNKERRFDEAGKVIPKPVFVYSYNKIQRLEIPEFKDLGEYIKNNSNTTNKGNTTISSNTSNSGVNEVNEVNERELDINTFEKIDKKPIKPQDLGK